MNRDELAALIRAVVSCLAGFAILTAAVLMSRWAAVAIFGVMLGAIAWDGRWFRRSI